MSQFVRFILSGIILLIIAGICLRPKSKFESKESSKQLTSQQVKQTEVQVFATEAGWGYTIHRKGKPYIQQLTIPAIEGNKGFSTREQALRAAQLVAYKIEQSILPPTVSRHELDSLHVLD